MRSATSKMLEWPSPKTHTMTIQTGNSDGNLAVDRVLETQTLYRYT